MALDGGMPRQHALDVAIQYGLAFAEGQRSDRRCSRTTHARQLRQDVPIARKLSPMLLHKLLRGTMQIARP